MKNCIIENNEAESGGGFYLKSHDYSTIIADCQFTDNQANNGGAIYCTKTSPMITDCTVSGNNIIGPSDHPNPHVNGGGIYLTNSSNAIIKNSRISGNVMSDNATSFGGGILCIDSSSPEIIGCEIEYNSALWGSGIASMHDSSPVIIDCKIRGNTAVTNPEFYSSGGGICCSETSAPRISNSEISLNSSDYGAGVHCFDQSNPIIKNCLIFRNEAFASGGALHSDGSSPSLISCTAADNTSSGIGGVGSDNTSDVFISNSILWNNTGGSFGGSGDLSITCSDVDGGVYGSSDCFSADPLFVPGPWGEYYLSQKSAGQDAESPCVDAGANPVKRFGLEMMTTRTDAIFDSGSVDIGYHYPPNVLFDLYISPGKKCFEPGDTAHLMLDVRTAGENSPVDIYFTINTPDGSVYSGMGWDEGLSPMISDLTLEGGIDITGLEFIEVDFSGDIQPIDDPGSYIFVFAATKAGTGVFRSNIATADFAFTKTIEPL